MKQLIVGFVLGLTLGSLAKAEDLTVQHSQEKDFIAGGNVRLMLASGDYTVRAGAGDRIRVQWEPRPDGNHEAQYYAKDAAKVKVRINVTGTTATLKTDSSRHVRFVIEIPLRSDLYLRMRAGDVRIAGIEGNKDVHMTAGNLRIETRPTAYSVVHASVTVGDLDARPLGMSKDGIGNSINWNGSGPYTLRASMFAGDLTLTR